LAFWLFRLHLAGLEPATFGSVDGSDGAARPDTPSTSGKGPSSVARQLPRTVGPDPDLARLLDAWPRLPEPIRRAILALVMTAH
jgi:hypothetical protein